MKEESKNIERRQDVPGDDVDLVEVARTIWANRKFIYKTVAVFVVLGLVVAFGSGVEYEASCKLIPNSRDASMGGLGSLGGLAGLAGISLDFGAQSTISPELYPQIVNSLPFQIQAINKEIKFSQKDTTVSSYVFLTELKSPSALSFIGEYTLGLPGKIRKVFSTEKKDTVLTTNVIGKSDIVQLSLEKSKFIESFRDRLEVEVDAKTGIITIACEMPDPYAAAQLTHESVKLLQQFIIEYKVSKAKENLEFVKERYNEAKSRFEKTQANLALFNDRNLNVITARALTEQQRLQNEYNLAFEVYQGLAKQLEQSELKVKEDTPVFTIVEPVKVPVEKSKPLRKLILAVLAVVGGMVGIIVVYFKTYILNR